MKARTQVLPPAVLGAIAWALTLAPALSFALLSAGVAEARPGGGHSYSGGGGGYSGGGGGYSGGGGGYSGGGGGGFSSYSSGGGGEAPGAIGVIIMILAFVLMMAEWYRRVHAELNTYESHIQDFSPLTPAPAAPAKIDWSALRARDDNFSRVVFEDFLFQLYARAHEARADAEAMAALAPYIVPGAREALAAREPVDVPITSVVIGSMRITQLRQLPDQFELRVSFEANVSTEAGRSWYLEERWTLIRDKSVLSKAPAEATALACPNCGAPFVSTAEQTCEYCAEVVDNGRFDWLVSQTKLVRSVELPPKLGGYAPELGTDQPTLVAWGFRQRFEAFLDQDEALTQAAIEARIHKIYDTLNIGWVARNLEHVRPYLSDGIWDYLSYWLDAYRRQGLINCLERMELESLEFVELRRDRYYDALTVRIFASGYDYTVRENDDDEVVGGSRTMPRRYSEYWTLIRGAGVSGEAHSDGGCPNCGAPLRVNMAGSCEHCSAHLTRGEFDWVLSRIEQDESYVG